MAQLRSLLVCTLLCFAFAVSDKEADSSSNLAAVETATTMEIVAVEAVPGEAAHSYYERARGMLSDAAGVMSSAASGAAGVVSSAASGATQVVSNAVSGAADALSSATTASGETATGALVDATWLIIGGAWTTAVPLLLAPITQVLHTYLVVAAIVSTAFATTSALAHTIAKINGSPQRVTHPLLGCWHAAICTILCVLLAFNRLRARGAEDVGPLALVTEALTGDGWVLITLVAMALLSTGVLVSWRRSISSLIVHVGILVMLLCPISAGVVKAAARAMAPLKALSASFTAIAASQSTGWLPAVGQSLCVGLLALLSPSALTGVAACSAAGGAVAGATSVLRAAIPSFVPEAAKLLLYSASSFLFAHALGADHYANDVLHGPLGVRAFFGSSGMLAQRGALSHCPSRRLCLTPHRSPESLRASRR